MPQVLPIPTEIERIATEVVDAALRVHRELGPGLLESVYEACVAFELEHRGLRIERQVPLPVVYKTVRLDAGLRIDLWVERQVVIELKSIEALLPIHTAQVLTYLRLSNCRLGFLVNFNVELIKNGIKRIAL